MKLHIWNDGCASQFRSRFVFAVMTYIDKSFQLAWYCNVRHHGNGAMDGVVNNKVFRGVKSFKVQINSPQCFAKYAEKFIHGIQCVYIAMDEIMEEPADVANAPT